MIKPAPGSVTSTQSRMIVVQNCHEELDRRVPVN
jgi:hypothetical protein